MSEFRIYVDPRDETIFALVDEIDYQWALRWRWSLKWSRGGTKAYARRVFQTSQGGWVDENGVWRRARTQTTVWLHREILIRSGKPQPTPEHVLAGHEDGDEMNCRRSNLLWETHSSNNRNRRPNGAALRRRLGL